MRRTIKTIFFMMLVACLFGANLVNAANPTVSVNPDPPVVQSEVTFTVEVDDQDVVGVWLKVQECNANTGICFPETLKNLSMSEQDGNYTVSTTLTHKDSTYIQYTIYVQNTSGWIEYLKDTKINLAEKPNGNGVTNGDGDSNGTPGFEVIFVLLAIIIGVTLYKRKRYR